jgi:serine/threonine protein kinase
MAARWFHVRLYCLPVFPYNPRGERRREAPVPRRAHPHVPASSGASTERAIDSQQEQTWDVGRELAGRYQVRQCLRYSATVCLYRAWDGKRSESRLLLGPGVPIVSEAAAREWFDSYCTAVLEIGPHRNVLTPERMDYEGEVPFLVMPDFKGFFWDQAIDSGKPSELPRMLSVALQVARGLAWLHKEGQIHYNVKPANVLITGSWVCKVWKYGEAQATTRAYASPEQLGHQRPLSPATDIWSWAASVLHMFVGKVTWDSGLKAPTILLRYKRHGPARGHLPQMPEQLEDLLSRCFRADPDERPAAMSEIVTEMEQIAQQAGPEEDGPGTLDWVDDLPAEGEVESNGPPSPTAGEEQTDQSPSDEPADEQPSS